MKRISLLLPVIIITGVIVCLFFVNRTYDNSAVTIQSVDLHPVIASRYDTVQHEAMRNLIEPYRREMEKTMNVVIGSAEDDYGVYRPESPLSNLVADMILYRARAVAGDVDCAITNVGGIRTTLKAGNITVGNVYEILPFDNALLVLDYKGSDIHDIADAIAIRGGEAVAGITFDITPSGKADNIKINGERIDDRRIYRVVTSDYLSFGNDNLAPLTRYISSFPLNIMLRDAMIDYIYELSSVGKTVSASTDGRIKNISDENIL